MASKKGKKSSNNNSTKTENVNKKTNVNKVKNNSKKVNDSEAENNIEEKLNIIDDLLGESEEKDKKLEDKKVEKSDNTNIKNRTTKKRTENKIVLKKEENSEEKKVEEKDELKDAFKAADEAFDSSKKTLVKKGTEIVKKDPVEILEKEHKEKRNKNKYRFLNIILFVTFVVVFSTIFALIFQSENTIVKGTKIKNIDVSNLTIEEAKQKITEAIELEFMQEAELYYSDEYKVTLKPDQINAEYDINKALIEAYQIGRSGNIVIDNYQILLAGFIGNNIDMDFTYNEDSLDLIVQDIASKIPGKVIDYNYSIEEDELIITKGTKGVKVDETKLEKDILEEIKLRNVEEILNSDKKIVIQIKVDEVEPAEININEVYNDIHKEPVDAYCETNPFKLYPEEDGIDFNISLDEAAKIIAVPNQEEYKIPLKITKATKTVNDIGTEAFPYLISTFSTKYDASNRNRSKNLELAASKINGTVLMPGEEFSYNKVVGKRTVEAGYKDAKIYSNGQVVDGLGGGICQISSTLYNAVLMADLEITERRNHYFKTSYVAAGRDATVVWGSIDFKFKNTRTYPIKIEAKVSNGIAEFKIHGIKEEKEYDIKILPVVTQTIPYGTQEIIDPTMAPGTSKVTQGGSSGCRVTTYIEKRLDGKVVSKEKISSDYYKPLNQTIKRAP